RQALDDVVGARAPDRGLDDRALVQTVEIAEADGVVGPELEPEEILERTGEPGAPLVGRELDEIVPVDLDASRRRCVELADQLDERRLAGAVLSHDRDD